MMLMKNATPDCSVVRKHRSFQHASMSQETGPGKTFPDYSCGSGNVYTPALSFGCAEVDFPNCLRSAIPLQKKIPSMTPESGPGRTIPDDSCGSGNVYAAM